MDEAPELKRDVHFCSGTKNDGGAAENGHLAMERWGIRRGQTSENASTEALSFLFLNSKERIKSYQSQGLIVSNRKRET